MYMHDETPTKTCGKSEAFRLGNTDTRQTFVLLTPHSILCSFLALLLALNLASHAAGPVIACNG